MRFLTIAEKLGNDETHYMIRWVINFGPFSLRVHHWNASDDDRAYHDHPWNFMTIVLSGGYHDVSEKGYNWLAPGTINFRKAEHAHTVQVGKDQHCWTFLICGPVIRKWGFWITKKSGKLKWIKANKFHLTY